MPTPPDSVLIVTASSSATAPDTCRHNVLVSGSYGGRITLFRTRGHPLLCSFEEDFGWSRLTAGVAVRTIPGSHEGIFAEPDVRVLAELLQRDLCAAQQSPDHQWRAPHETL